MASAASSFSRIFHRRAMLSPIMATKSRLIGGVQSVERQRLCRWQQPTLLFHPAFSTAAVKEAPTKKAKSKRRRTLETKDPIIVVRYNSCMHCFAVIILYFSLPHTVFLGCLLA